MRATRRDLLTGATAAAAGALVPAGAMAGVTLSLEVSPELLALFERRDQLNQPFEQANTDADELAFAIDRGEPAAIARAAELPALRQAEDDAIEAFDGAETAIVDFPARTIGDVLAKLVFFGQEQGLLPSSEGVPMDEHPWPGRLYHAALADLRRFAASTT